MARTASSIPWKTRRSSTAEGRCRVRTAKPPLRAPNRCQRRSSSARRRCFTSVSIITFPTRCTRSPAMPSRSRFWLAVGSVVKSHVEIASTAIRFFSSGILESKERRPASTWATGRPRCAAARAQASVESTSPTTMARSGRSCATAASNAASICAARASEPGSPAGSSTAGPLMPSSRIRGPAVELPAGDPGSDARAAQIEAAFGAAVAQLRPDLAIVVGDVDSTLACARAAAQRGLPVAHVEAGLRSFDSRMPEEKNRIAVDAISTWLFTTEPTVNQNLEREGIAGERVHLVGNVMIDTLVKHRRRAEELRLWQRFGARRGGFAVLTLHRPSAVHDRCVFQGILEAVRAIQRVVPVVFPIHPRTRRRLLEFALERSLRAMEGLTMLPPLGYLEFLSLLIGARFVLTDSGGV